MRTIAVIVAITLSSQAALAQENSPDFARNGFYIGGGLAIGKYTQLEDETEDLLAELGYIVEVDVGIPVGGDVQMGYRLHPHFAVQAHLTILPNAEIELNGLELLEIDALVVTGDLKVFALTGRLQPYALVGVGSMKTKISDSGGFGFGSSTSASDFAVRLAGGLEYYATQAVVLQAELGGILTSGDVKNTDLFTANFGVLLRF
jgi:opacity protein-like surface antigen